MGNANSCATKNGAANGRSRATPVVSKTSSSKTKKRPSTDTSSASSFGSESVTGLVLRKDTPIPSDCPPDLKLVRDFIRFKDEHNLAEMKKLTADRCDFLFIDSDCEMPAREFYDTQNDVNQSFPDLTFRWKSMSIKGVNGPDTKHPGTVVVIKSYYGVGSHTGKPYGFGPYPHIPATGKRCRDKKIEFTFVVRDGKICHAMIDAFGQVVGPPGFYTQIGGLIF